MLTLIKSAPHHAIINRAALADTTKAQYRKAIDNLIAAGIDPRNRDALADYAGTLKNSSRAFLKSALRLLFAEQITLMKSQATAGNLAEIQAALYNIDAINDTIHVTTPRGQRSHNWLTAEQVTELTTMDTSNAQSMRDYLTLGLLLHGLRRDEAARATYADIKTIPDSNGRPRPVLDVLGKGGRYRTIPLNENFYNHLTGQKFPSYCRIIRSLGGTSISGQAIQAITRKHGRRIGLTDLNPHDLRRTYGHLIYNGTRDITRTMTLLGHADTKTTLRYLNLSLDVDSDVTQFVPIGG